MGREVLLRHTPEGSSNLRMKYLLESDTGSTATPGKASTGHIAKSSPERKNTINAALQRNIVYTLKPCKMYYRGVLII